MKQQVTEDAIKQYEDEFKRNLEGILHDQLLEFEKKLDTLVLKKLPIDKLDNNS